MTSVTHDFVVSEPRVFKCVCCSCSSKIQCHLKRTVLGADELLLVIEIGTTLLIYLKRKIFLLIACTSFHLAMSEIHTQSAVVFFFCFSISEYVASSVVLPNDENTW